jgi:hypothetical protein
MSQPTYFWKNVQSQAAFGTAFWSHRQLSESRNKLSKDGYWKDFHNWQVIS